ncbi:MAG: prepilin-type N-terminal cleavage/methylation domain-containing protein [Deltaproteobacteria bacterium]
MKRQAGFSLIELMTAIAIIAILAAIATPNVFTWVATQRFNSGVRDVQATVQSMRLFALKENSMATITFTNGANKYKTVKWKRGLGTSQTEFPPLPTGVTVSSTAFTNGVLGFNSRGMPIGSNGNATSGTITVTGQVGNPININVTLTGRAQIQ